MKVFQTNPGSKGQQHTIVRQRNFLKIGYFYDLNPLKYSLFDMVGLTLS